MINSKVIIQMNLC